MANDEDLKALIAELRSTNELLREQLQHERQKVDIQDIFAQLNTPAVDKIARHYFSWNFRLTEMIKERARRAAGQTYDFIDKELRHASYQMDQFSIIRDRKDAIVSLDGHILDLGVYKGASTRALASIYPDRTIHGFDSFEGLPEDWSHVSKGAFGDVKGQLPNVPENVLLYKGWFEDSLPAWVDVHKPETISLLRVDCDIYSSTKTIFEVLGPFLKPGSWICFDELIGYYGWQDHEHKAFLEFLEGTDFEYEYVAYGLTYVLAKLK